jgi:predicted transcriptional regulator
MIAAELTNQMIPPLKMSDQGAKALDWMEELRTSELPVVQEGKFMGLLSEDIILETNSGDLPVASYPLMAATCKVLSGTHYYDIIKIAADHHVKMVAVVDASDIYQGVITVQDTVTAFSQTMAVQSPGAILVLSMPAIDYSLATISRLIEENNAKILSACITEDPMDSSLVKLTLKINQTDLTRIIATLERFEYRVIGRFQDTGADEIQEDRFGLLMKYLNI